MYDTGTILTPQRFRRSLGEIMYFEQDPDIGFHVQNIATNLQAQGTGWPLYKANGYQAALKNVLCAVDPLHATANRFLVPAHRFTAARHTNQAGAEAAFIAAFKGINLLAPPAGKRDKIPVATYCECLMEVEASTFIAGDLLTCSWDSTNGWIHPFRLKKTVTANLAIAKVVETNPLLPRTGNVTQVLAMFKVGNLP